MIYIFKCECGAVSEEVMLAKDYTDKIDCGECGKRMNRVFLPPRVSVPVKDGWNPALGCSERGVKEKIRKLRDSGIDVEETGNERVRAKPVHNNYELSDRDVHELNQIVG